MIHVLVMANNSLLADFLVSTLSQEVDMDVFRETRDALGGRRDFSVVFVFDEEMTENESIELREINREDTDLLLIRMSSKSKNVFVDESFRLANPSMGQIVNLLREFNRKSRSQQAEERINRQKKMMIGHNRQVGKYDRQNSKFPLKNFPSNGQVTEPARQTKIRVNRLSLLFEVWNSFTSFSVKTQKPWKRDAVESPPIFKWKNKV